MRRTVSRWGLGVGIALVGAMAVLMGPAAVPASAHPLGNFSVNRYTEMLVSPEQVRVNHVLDLAEIPTAQLGDDVDDPPAVAARLCTTAGEDLDLVVAGSAVPLDVLQSTATVASGQGGLPVVRVECLLEADVDLGSGSTAISLVDAAGGAQLGWREMVAHGDRATLVRSDVPDASVSDRLSDYPDDLLDTPLNVRELSVLAEPGGARGELSVSRDGQQPTSRDDGVGVLTERVASMIGEPGVWAGLLTLLAAFVLGAGHALAPGHGKTVMAFYLLEDDRRSVRAAAAVGLSVTLAHTASVLALGGLVAVGTSIVPDQVYPWLQVASGLLVLGLGVILLRSAMRRGTGSSGHTHSHAHGHHHHHSHAPPDPVAQPAGGVTTASTAVVTAPRAAAMTAPHTHHEHAPASRRVSVLTLGLAGGIVPSPSALLLLLAATAVGRAWFGAAAVLTFGLGMAVTLCVVGLLATSLADRLTAWAEGTRRWQRVSRGALSYVAAVGVCVVGALLVVRTMAGM